MMNMHRAAPSSDKLQWKYLNVGRQFGAPSKLCSAQAKFTEKYEIKKKKSTIGDKWSTPPISMAHSANTVDSTNARNGSLCLVTGANIFSQGIMSSLAIDCNILGAPTVRQRFKNSTNVNNFRTKFFSQQRHCKAAPNVAVNEPTNTTHLLGQASSAATMR